MVRQDMYYFLTDLECRTTQPHDLMVVELCAVVAKTCLTLHILPTSLPDLDV